MRPRTAWLEEWNALNKEYVYRGPLEVIQFVLTDTLPSSKVGDEIGAICHDPQRQCFCFISLKQLTTKQPKKVTPW